MAGEGGQEADSLISRLAAEPYAFDFFQAVRRLECSLGHGAHRIGYSDRPAEDPVRFCQPASLAFAPATLASFVPGDASRPSRLYVNFFGLLGPNGPMPLYFTEYVRGRQLHHDDYALARFLDVFHHRMISFFYRAWAVNQQTVSYEREREDRFAVYIGSLFGVGMPSLRGRDEVSDTAKLHYAGRLVCQTKNAEGLEAILKDYFKVPAQVSQFVGQWLDVPPDCRCRLGESVRTGLLGVTTIVGRRMWECQQRLRIILGPMTLAAYLRFLPGQDTLRRLSAWMRLYIGEEFEWDAQLVLRADEVPGIRLGGQGRLGWTTWLVSKTVGTDAADLVLRPAYTGPYRNAG